MDKLKIKGNGHSITARGGADIHDVDLEGVALINDGTAKVYGKLRTDSQIWNKGVLIITKLGEVTILMKRSIDNWSARNPILSGVIVGLTVLFLAWFAKSIYSALISYAA